MTLSEIRATQRRTLPADMLAFRAHGISPAQSAVIASYIRAFATRGVGIRPSMDVGPGHYIFTDGCAIGDKERHCYWNLWDNAALEPEADGCAWLWHHGPNRTLVAGERPRVIVLPRNDLFEMRGVAVENTPEGWAEYRTRIGVPWDEKRPEVYFLGHFTGEQTVSNLRIRAGRMLREAGLPAHVGLRSETTPRHLVHLALTLEPEPLHVMGEYRFVLSLWGNHPFNPRLYRGLEAGSLVFHQATPQIHFLDDGLLVPGRDYVEIAPDLSDLVDKVAYFLAHPAEAREIADAGHRTWMETLFVPTPYTMSDVLWERFTSQPNWPEFLKTFDEH
jgi:hypothetical protein